MAYCEDEAFKVDVERRESFGVLAFVELFKRKAICPSMTEINIDKDAVLQDMTPDFDPGFFLKFHMVR